MRTPPLFLVKFEPLLDEWHLTGPVGARGLLRFGTAREAASHARWEGSLQGGGLLEVRDKAGAIFKTETLAAKRACKPVDERLPRT